MADNEQLTWWLISFVVIGGETVMSDTKLGAFVQNWSRVVEVSFVFRVDSNLSKAGLACFHWQC